MEQYSALFEIIKEFTYFKQRDILMIVVDIFSLKKDHKFLEFLWKYIDLKYEDILELHGQDSKLKKHYRLLIIDDFNIKEQKYLNYLLEYLMQKYQYKNENIDLTIINSFEYNSDVKDFIKNNIDNIDRIKIEINSNSLNLCDKRDNIFSKAHTVVSSLLAFSSDNGEYGIEVLSKGTTNSVHIFVNGFTNDTEDGSFIEWMKNTKEIYNQEDTFLGYKWASGKDPSNEILKLANINNLKDPSNYLNFMRGFSPAIIISTLSVQLLAEWKNARNNSKKFSKDLALFIQKKSNGNKQIKINLYGHSLGANLIHHTLEYLFHENIRVNNVHLFGGASKIDEIAWTHSLGVVENLYNFYSNKDLVLKLLYKAVEVGDEPIGLNPIKYKNINTIKQGTLINRDVSYRVEGHSKYINNLHYLLY